jgi:hypothetical protein
VEIFSRWLLGDLSVNIVSNNTPEKVFSVQSMSSLHKGDSLCVQLVQSADDYSGSSVSDSKQDV